MLEAREVSMQYSGTLALDRVTFRVPPGKVAALIGENGAGKSTLVKILAGVARPTGGTLTLDGVPIALASVRDADALGIGIIHQELNLCPNLSVAENIYLAREIAIRGMLDRDAQEAGARELLARLEHPINPRALVGDLPLGQQQIVEIAKTLARNTRILMMDEPTSALSAAEIAILFRIIRDLKSRGVGIVYISHRLDELLAIADTVSVLRDGRLVAESDAAVIDTRWIVERMTGRPAGAVNPSAAPVPGPPLLRVDNLSLAAPGGRPLLRGVSFGLHAGEIVGIYGLMGAGRTEMLECLMGLHREAAGSIFLDSRRLDSLDTAARISAGLAMAPEDRQTSSLVPTLSVLANMTLSAIDRFARGGWLSTSAEESAGAEVAASLRVRHAGLRRNIGSLSGGNQQKVVLARCLLTHPRVLLLDEPTRGVDVSSKSEIHAIVARLAASGMGVVLVSSELEEVRATAHRVLVMSRGELTAELSAADATDAALASAAGSQGVPQ